MGDARYVFKGDIPDPPIFQGSKYRTGRRYLSYVFISNLTREMSERESLDQWSNMTADNEIERATQRRKDGEK